MKILISILTCHKYKNRADSQRATWVPKVALVNSPHVVDTYFFLGKGPTRVKEDEVILDVNDGYEALPAKTRTMFKWALDHGYDYVFKCDDDTFVEPGRLLNSGFEGHDYVGRLRGPSGGQPAPYASGFSYWVSRRAMEVVVSSIVNNGEQAEDRMVGNVLHAAGIECKPDYRYVVIKSDRNGVSGNEGPLVGNDVISACELSTKEMAAMHYAWERGDRSRSRPIRHTNLGFDKLSVMVKTFLRDGHLKLTVEEVERSLPGAKMIVVDDGRESKEKIVLYSQLRDRGHTVAWMPFDSGFCAKSNKAVSLLDRPYLLIASDDFEFSGISAPEGVRRMMAVLDGVSNIGVASGRVDNVPYEGFIERGEDYIKEIPLDPKSNWSVVNGSEYKLCDLTVNYNVVRKAVFDQGVKWDEAYKIGGDHFEFYDQVKKLGWEIAHVRGASIHQRGFRPAFQHPDYAKYRARAKDALPRFFEKYGIIKYVGFDGREDVLQPDGTVSIGRPPQRTPIVDGGIMERRIRAAGLSNDSIGHLVFVADKAIFKSSMDGAIVDGSYRGSKTLFMKPGGTISMDLALELGLVYL